MFFGDALEIGGEIIRGEGILLAAEIGDELGKLALRIIFCCLEHQMFEKMRDARLAERIIGRAVAIPEHVRHDRRPAIGNDHDVEAIVEFGSRHGWAGHLSRRPFGGGKSRGCGRRLKRISRHWIDVSAR